MNTKVLKSEQLNVDTYEGCDGTDSQFNITEIGQSEVEILGISKQTTPKGHKEIKFIDTTARTPDAKQVSMGLLSGCLAVNIIDLTYDPTFLTLVKQKPGLIDISRIHLLVEHVKRKKPQTGHSRVQDLDQ